MSALSSCIWCSAARRMRSDWSSTSNLGSREAGEEESRQWLEKQCVKRIRGWCVLWSLKSADNSGHDAKRAHMLKGPRAQCSPTCSEHL